MDYMKVNGYSETLCQVISQLVQAELKSLKYDKTIKCTIIDTSKSNYGCYTVSDGTTQYLAYTQNYEDYKINDSVYITIPNGDINEQAFILGKEYGETEPDYFPLKDFLSAERARMAVDVNGKPLPIGLEANGSEMTTQIYSSTSWREELNLDLVGGQDITHLAFSAKISTTLPTCRKGNFGIKMILSYIDKANRSQEKTIYFSSADMYGTIYQLKGSTQKFLVSLGALNIKKIVSIEFYLYQQGDFYDYNGQPIKLSDQLTIKNIVLNDFIVEAGYNKNNFSPNTILLYPENEGKTYSKDNTSLGAIYWICVVELTNGTIARFNVKSNPEYNYTILQYDSEFDGDNATLPFEKDEWRTYDKRLEKDKNIYIKDFEGNLNEDQSGLDFILYKLTNGEKIKIANQRILFYKKKEKKEG